MAKESFLNIHFIMKWIIFYTLIWLKKMRIVIFKKMVELFFLECFGNIKEDICMEEKLIIPMLFFFIAALGGICLLMFCFRKNDDGYDYDKIMRMMHEQTDENLDALSKMNKEKRKDRRKNKR